MPDENTPLIAVVQVRPRRQRYPHSSLRRFCTCLLATLLVISLTSILLTLLIAPECDNSRQSHHGYQPCIPKHPFNRDRNDHFHWGDRGIYTQADFTYDDLVNTLISTPNEKKAREWNKYYSSGPHLAGQNFSQAQWTQDRWVEFGIPTTDIVAYEVYLNYPLDHRLALLEAKSNKSERDFGSKQWKVKYEASLKEDVLEEDETSGLKDRIQTFHGYSASGNVTAPYVFVNYGTYQDFEDLLSHNISLKGKIALAKYGAIFRGLKIKRAQELGMVGVVLYSDPGDDGNVTEANGAKQYPEGPARNPSSVQRGSAQFLCKCISHVVDSSLTDLAVVPGDPTTPGYPSKPGAPRQSANVSTPSIPSLPISYVDAIPLLKALKGHGPKAKSFGKYWEGGGLEYKGVDYYVGPTPDDVALNLYNKQNYTITPIWNVFGVINGTIEDEVVVVGNHRDAWIAAGAGDPGSGSAALMEVVRGFGAALAKGWKPLRTVVFASWDGEEYGLLGSTEWVEEYLPWLNKSTIAYINVDVGAVGPNYKASAAPLLEKALIQATKLVISPNQTVTGQTVYDVWDKRISTMGSGSDFTAFQDYAGIPSLDMGFSAGKNDPVYQYHSNYDSFSWMEKFGDPGFHYHVTAARILALVAAQIAETPIIPLNVTDYADGLQKYLDSAKQKASASSDPAWSSLATGTWTPFQGLEGAIGRLRNTSVKFDADAEDLLKKIQENPLPWWRWWERIKLRVQVQNINTKYKTFERQFLYEKGLDGRTWFKHVVFAPGRWTGYAGATFPGLVEAIEDKNEGGLFKWLGIITGLVENARKSIADDE